MSPASRPYPWRTFAFLAATGAKLLTDGLPRTPDEVERWMAERSR